MPSTYDKIATTTLGSAAASYTFSSIPGTYTDLIIIANGGISITGDVGLRFNGDASTNYSYTRVYGNGSATASDRGSNWDYAAAFTWYSATLNNSAIFNIMNYSNTTTYKTVVGRTNSPSTLVGAVANLWRSTAAITSIQIISPGGSATYSVGTTFTLYGIKAA